MVKALEGVTFAQAEGEFVAVLGPSGCGKTTLLRILAGLEKATEGSFSIQGSNSGRPQNAMVFQGNAVFPWMTVRGNITYGLRVRGVARQRRERVAIELMQKVGLARFADAYPHQLSEGMRQRVNIARAFAMDPEVLLMDEPFSNLDEQNRFLMHEELLRIWQEMGKTILFVTHSIEEALVLADRILVMTARPGTIKAAVEVPFQRPRDAITIRSHPRFASLSSELWGLLREEVLRSRQTELG